MNNTLNINVKLKLTRKPSSEEKKKIVKKIVELLDGTSGIIDDVLVDNFFVSTRNQSKKNSFYCPPMPDSKLKF